MLAGLAAGVSVLPPFVLGVVGLCDMPGMSHLASRHPSPGSA